MMRVCPCVCPYITHLLHHKPAGTGDNWPPQVFCSLPATVGDHRMMTFRVSFHPSVCPSILQIPAALKTCCDVRQFFVPPTIEMMTVCMSFHPSHFCCITNLLDGTLGHRRYFLFKSSQVLMKQKTNKLTLKPIKSIYYMLMCDISFQSSLLWLS